MGAWWYIIGVIGILWLVAPYGETYQDIPEGYEVTYPDNYVGADGHQITLYNSVNATNPTYSQVIDFIDDDNTDDIPYNESSFTCGDYAELVHNNAEQAGYTCGWIAVNFDDGSVGHACNVFNTTDRGLVYIDCTEADKTVDLRVGEMYTPHRIYDDSVTYESMGCVSSYDGYW